MIAAMPYHYHSEAKRLAALAAAVAAEPDEVVIPAGTTIFLLGSTRPYLIKAPVPIVYEVEPEPDTSRDPHG